MKLGTRARYSLRLMLAVAKLGVEGKPVPLEDISRATKISRSYLDQLTVSLKNLSLLRGHSGRSGGYTLGKPAGEIRLAEIIQAAIGPIAIVDCAVDPNLCPQSEFCDCMPLWELVNRRIVEVLDAYSLADLLDRDWLSKIRSMG